MINWTTPPEMAAAVKAEAAAALAEEMAETEEYWGREGSPAVLVDNGVHYSALAWFDDDGEMVDHVCPGLDRMEGVKCVRVRDDVGVRELFEAFPPGTSWKSGAAMREAMQRWVNANAALIPLDADPAVVN